MNGKSAENNYKAQLAARFNEFYLQITSPEVTQIGNYQITSDLGEGAFGKVYLATHVLLNVQVVLKCGPKDDPNIVREIYYHSQLRHKHIVKLYEVIKTETHLWMVLEYCEGNELYYHIYNSRRLDYKQCQHLFYQIMLGVSYVHSLNLCHRDLKLENILLADQKKSIVKLTDFGFVREFNPAKRSLLSTICGTTVYMAPEMLSSSKYSGFSVDIWSLGIILYTMFYGEMPFDEDDDMQNKYKIVYEEPTYREIIPKDAIELLKKMLTKDPKKRATITDIMNSSFLSGVNIGRKNSAAQSKKRISDTESILSINQHFQQFQDGAPSGVGSSGGNSNSGGHSGNRPRVPFESKIEKNLLKSFKKLNVDLEQIQRNIIENKTNSLTAFYELALTREYKRKKMKYYQERRRKYKEARRSLKNSRQKVKSVLSLTDQNNGTQPLERILSSLSISSRGGQQNQPMSSQSSQHGVNKAGDRRSIASVSKEPTNGSVSTAGLSSVHKQPTIGSVSMAPIPSSPKGSSYGAEGVQRSPSSRTVSFHNPDKSTSYTLPYQNSADDRTRKRRILNKLQFWKKGGEEMDDIHEEKQSIGNTISNTNSSEGKERYSDEKKHNTNEKYQKDQSPSYRDEARLQSEKDGSAPKLYRAPSELSPRTQTPTSGPINSRSASGNKPFKNSDRGTPTNPNTADSNEPLGANNTSGVSANNSINGNIVANGSFTGLMSRESSGYYTSKNRTRPSSVISQMSQLSHLSQLSTMISESELDMLGGGTDTMDDEDYYDEDGMYESSVNNSHNDLKNLATGMTPSSSSVSRRGVRKRPSYRRQMSSDMSIMTTSTTNTAAQYKTKPKLSQVSSNTSSISEQSSLNDRDVTQPPIGLDSMMPDRSYSPTTQTVPTIVRTGSPVQQLRSPIPNGVTSTHAINNNQHNIVNGSGTGNGFASSNLFSTFMNGMHNEPFTRSHSPPVPDKFKKIKRKGGAEKGKLLPSVIQSSSPSPTSASPAAGASASPTNVKDTHQVEDKLVKGPKPVLATTMYGPKFIINEEEEDEEEDRGAHLNTTKAGAEERNGDAEAEGKQGGLAKDDAVGIEVSEAVVA